MLVFGKPVCGPRGKLHLAAVVGILQHAWGRGYLLGKDSNGQTEESYPQGWVGKWLDGP